jgi:hypothetical protein
LVVDPLMALISADQLTATMGGLRRKDYWVRESTTTTAHGKAARGERAHRCGVLHAHTIRQMRIGKRRGSHHGAM